MLIQNAFSSKMDNLARYFVLISILTLAFSPTFNNAYVLGIVCTLFAGQLALKYEIVRSFKMNWVAMLLILLFAIGMFYNPYGLGMGWHYFQKEAHRLLAPLFLLPLFINGKYRRIAINCLIIGAVASALYNFETIHRIFPPIPYSMYLAFVEFVLIHRMLHDNKHRMIYSASFVLLFYTLFFVNIERTGMLVFFVLMITAAIQRLKFKGFVISLLASLLLMNVLYFTSSRVHQRVNAAVSNVVAYKHNNVTLQNSLGIRLLVLKYGLQNLKQKPLLGFGTGMYSAGNVGVAKPDMDHGRKTPENAFLHVALQIGLIGLAAFLFWVFAQIYESNLLPTFERHLAQGIIIAAIIINSTVPAFTINLSATLYLLMITILFAARFEHRVEELASELVIPIIKA